MNIRLRGVNNSADCAETKDSWEDNDIILSTTHGGDRIELDIKGHLVQFDFESFRKAIEALR